jgi:hypothetical protein
MTLGFHGVAMRKSPALVGGRGARPESLLAGTATPALLGCPRLQGRWAGGRTGAAGIMALQRAHCHSERQREILSILSILSKNSWSDMDRTR